MSASRVHGGPDLRELGALGLDAGDLLDFSVNVNPYGAAPAVLEAARSAALDRYPDARAPAVLGALAGAWDVEPGRLCLGNGAAELLWTLVALLCRGRGPLLVVEPAFCEPALAARAAGVPVVAFGTGAADGFALDVGALVAAARAAHAPALYLGSPGNPSGRLVAPEALASLARSLPETIILLDEAFLALSRGADHARIVLPENVVRVRSLTKEHALPGLRVGALMAPARLVAALEEARPAWTVSAPALAAVAAVVALGEGFVAELRARWLGDAAALAAELAGLSLTVLPSDTVFHLVDVGDAGRLRGRLLARHGILVRDCASFGLPRYVRVVGRPSPDRARFLRAMRQEL